MSRSPDRLELEPGAVLDGRFELLERAGAGGMGTVYRARDRQSGEICALKVVPHVEGPEALRFRREVEILAELRHPNVVRYIAHGSAGEDGAYLAMDWLEGPTLRKRLKEGGRLPAEDGVKLAWALARGLAAAHERGIVHRDLKPTNVLLPGGDTARATLIDFGVAMPVRSVEPLTATGVLVGTPHYMAPEQARGERDLDARVDVFALGAVLYEGLTGRRPFRAEDSLGVLLKIVLDEPEPLGAEVPEDLRRLVHALLAKERAARPLDGADLMRRLGSLSATQPSQPSLTYEERRVAALVLARVRAAGGAPASVRSVASIRTACDPLGGHLDVLADGSVLVTLDTGELATELAARAARCALALQRSMPEARMAVVIDRSAADEGGPRPMVERAVDLVSAARPGDILVDPTSADLLGARFEVADAPPHVRLVRARPGPAVRTLLGKSTPYVGRQHELSLLAAMMEECFSDRAARVALVLGEAGIGKSRLRHELQRLAEVGAPGVLSAVADPVQQAPYGVAAGLVASAAGARAGEPSAVRREKLEARLAQVMGGERVAPVREFLAELIGAGVDDDDTSPHLTAARADPVLMKERVRDAWTEWVVAECTARPVLLVIEDLHWVDAQTVELVDAALSRSAELPLMVLALARPELTERFPDVWASHAVTRISLSRLSRKASRELVDAVLGSSVETEAAERLVAQAGGNAFFLEELVRNAAEHGLTSAPESVLAMLDRRLASLPSEARRVLRAASVFGNVFWDGAVAHLLGGAEQAGDVTEALASLARLEVVAEQPVSRVAFSRELVFRHALVREAAYRMLTDEDHVLAHRLAAEWLAQAGVDDAATIAMHFERGQAPLAAVPWWRRAAERAADANDWRGVVEATRRGKEAGAGGRELGLMLILEAIALGSLGESGAMIRRAMAARELFEPGSLEWGRAVEQAVVGAGQKNDWDMAERLCVEVRGLLERGPVARSVLVSAARIDQLLMGSGRAVLPGVLLPLVEAHSTDQDKNDPALRARILSARGSGASCQGDVAGYYQNALQVIEQAELAGDARSANIARVNVGFALAKLGAYEEAERKLVRAKAYFSEHILPAASIAVLGNLGHIAQQTGRLDAARKWLEACITIATDVGDRRQQGTARACLALVHDAGGHLDPAEAQARRAVEMLEHYPPTLSYALAALATVMLHRGRLDDALAPAERATTLLASKGSAELGTSLARLVYAEVLLARREGVAARRAIVAARDDLLRRNELIGDPERQKSFLATRENVRILALADQWLGPAD